jgi:hypothetical protein
MHTILNGKLAPTPGCTNKLRALLSCGEKNFLWTNLIDMAGSAVLTARNLLEVVWLWKWFIFFAANLYP